VPVKARRSPLVPGVVTAILALAAIYMWQVSRTAANPELPRLAAGLAIGAAAAVLILFVLRRR
jgi:hypothetical protein